METWTSKFPAELEKRVLLDAVDQVYQCLFLQIVCSKWKATLWEHFVFDTEKLYPLFRKSSALRLGTLASLPRTLASVRRCRFTDTSLEDRSDVSIENLTAFCKSFSPQQLESLELAAAAFAPKLLAFNFVAHQPMPQLKRLWLSLEGHLKFLNVDLVANIPNIEELKFGFSSPSLARAPLALLDALAALPRLQFLSIAADDWTLLRKSTSLVALHLIRDGAQVPDIVTQRARNPPGVGINLVVEPQELLALNGGKDLLWAAIAGNDPVAVTAVLQAGFDMNRTWRMEGKRPPYISAAMLGKQWRAAEALLDFAPVKSLTPLYTSQGELVSPLKQVVRPLVVLLAESKVPEPFLGKFKNAWLAARKTYSLDELLGTHKPSVLSKLNFKSFDEYTAAQKVPDWFDIGPVKYTGAFNERGCPLSHVISSRFLPRCHREFHLDWHEKDLKGRNAIQCFSAREDAREVLGYWLLHRSTSDEEFVEQFTPLVVAHLRRGSPQKAELLHRLIKLVPESQWKDLITAGVHLQIRLYDDFTTGVLDWEDPEFLDASKTLRQYAHQALFEEFDPYRWLELLESDAHRQALFRQLWDLTPQGNMGERHFAQFVAALAHRYGPQSNHPQEWAQFAQKHTEPSDQYPNALLSLFLPKLEGPN